MKHAVPWTAKTLLKMMKKFSRCSRLSGRHWSKEKRTAETGVMASFCWRWTSSHAKEWIRSFSSSFKLKRYEGNVQSGTSRFLKQSRTEMGSEIFV